MKITIENYEKEIKKVDWQKIPKDLNQLQLSNAINLQKTINEDSVWLNTQLNYLKKGSGVAKNNLYELVEVKKIFFVEQDPKPFVSNTKPNTPLKAPFSSGVKFSYGDSLILFEGGKNYTDYGVPMKG